MKLSKNFVTIAHKPLRSWGQKKRIEPMKLSKNFATIAY